MSLINIFGEGPAAKVLDFFRVQCYWDYSLKDVRQETGVSYRTLQMLVPRLVKMGVLKYTRTEGKAKLYQFNRDSKLAKQLQTIAVLDDLGDVLETQKGAHPEETRHITPLEA